MEKDKIDETIIELATRQWNEQERPLLLSQLGMHDSKLTQETKKYHSTLRKYILNELRASLRLAQHSQKPEVIGVVPRNPTTEAIVDFDPILERCFESAGNASREKRIRFLPIFWQAFKMPLANEERRFIIENERLDVQDLANSTGEPENAIEVERQFIAGLGADVDDEKIYQNILSWAAKHKISPAQFSYSAIARRFRKNARIEENNFLYRLLNLLSEEDLRRINLPMDIVLKLASSK